MFRSMRIYVIFVAVALLAGLVTRIFLHEREGVKEPSVAGAFYPSKPSELKSILDKMSEVSSPIHLNGELKALIVPHAGYQYSGVVAAEGYSFLERPYKKIFILSSNHNERATSFRLALPRWKFLKTPLGPVRVSPIVEKWLKDPLFQDQPLAFDSHVIEVQLPFLQHALKDFEIIPVVTGDARAEDLLGLAKHIVDELDQDSLIIVSSDLSHYYPYDKAVAIDQPCVKAVASQQLEGVHCEACGLPAILVLLNVARQKGWQAQLIDYKNSGDTTGDKARVVGYSSIAFYEPPFSKAEAAAMIQLSRAVLTEAVITKQSGAVTLDSALAGFQKPQACFVTLEKKGRLRGCVGHLQATMNLPRCILENTVSAASRDRRFSPVTPDEVKDLRLEISVLSDPVVFEHKSKEELLRKLRPYQDGVILTVNSKTAVFLPQVWEMIPQKEIFLTELCKKGEMLPDCWQEPGTQVSLFHVSLIREN